MKAFSYGSLFSGIGGFDLGLDQAGMSCAWQVERDKAARSVLKNHWPDVPKYEDVKNVGKRNLKSVDLICGGFPCQDVSAAGRREGLAGERSGLWFEFRRIIAELKPQWVIIENVPGLLSSNGGRDMGAIVGALAKLGYWWAYRVLDAQYWGVPQRRRRVFIVGCLTKGCAQEVLFERESSPWDTPPSRETGAELAGTLAADAHASGFNGQDAERGMLVNSFEIHGGSKRKDRPDGGFYVRSMPTTKPLDTGELNPNCAQGGHLCFVQNSRDEVRLMNGDGQIAGALSAQPGMKQQNYVALDARNFNETGDVTSTLQSKKSGGYSLNYQPLIRNTFNSYTGGADDNDTQGRHLVGRQAGVRRLTPLEAERLQGFPDNWTENGLYDIIDMEIHFKEDRLCQMFVEWINVIEVSLSDQKSYVLSTTNAGKGGAIRVSRIPTQEKIQEPVFIAIEMLTVEKCVCDITNPGNGMVTLFSLNETLEIEETKGQAILNKTVKQYTRPLWRILLGGNLTKEKLSIILIWIKEIMTSKIFIYASQEKNITDVIIVWNESQQSYTNEVLLRLRMGNIISQSDSARYRQLGNAVAVPVADWIGRRIHTIPITSGVTGVDIGATLEHRDSLVEIEM